MAVNELNKLDLARLEDIVNANRLWFDQAGVSKALAVETLKAFLDANANVDDLTIEMGTNNVLQIKAHSLDEGYFTTEFNARLDGIEEDIADEIEARTSADETLQSNIDAEELARTQADNVLQGNINDEALARSNADTTLQTNINNEALARSNADTTLQTNINNEALARAQADTALDGRLDTLETNNTGTNTGDETAQRIGTLINNATAKTTPVDADLFGLADSAASNVLKKFSWSSLKTAIKSYYDSVISTLTNKSISGATNTLSNIPSSALATQMKTVVSLTSPTPDYIGQNGRDSSGNNYVAIALSGTMWELSSGWQILYTRTRLGVGRVYWDADNGNLVFDNFGALNTLSLILNQKDSTGKLAECVLGITSSGIVNINLGTSDLNDPSVICIKNGKLNLGTTIPVETAGNIFLANRASIGANDLVVGYLQGRKISSPLLYQVQYIETIPTVPNGTVYGAQIKSSTIASKIYYKPETKQLIFEGLPWSGDANAVKLLWGKNKYTYLSTNGFPLGANKVEIDISVANWNTVLVLVGGRVSGSTVVLQQSNFAIRAYDSVLSTDLIIGYIGWGTTFQSPILTRGYDEITNWIIISKRFYIGRGSITWDAANRQLLFRDMGLNGKVFLYCARNTADNYNNIKLIEVSLNSTSENDTVITLDNSGANDPSVICIKNGKLNVGTPIDINSTNIYLSNRSNVPASDLIVGHVQGEKIDCTLLTQVTLSDVETLETQITDSTNANNLSALTSFMQNEPASPLTVVAINGDSILASGNKELSYPYQSENQYETPPRNNVSMLQRYIYDYLNYNKPKFRNVNHADWTKSGSWTSELTAKQPRLDKIMFPSANGDYAELTVDGADGEWFGLIFEGIGSRVYLGSVYGTAVYRLGAWVAPPSTGIANIQVAESSDGGGSYTSFAAPSTYASIKGKWNETSFLDSNGDESTEYDDAIDDFDTAPTTPGSGTYDECSLYNTYYNLDPAKMYKFRVYQNAGATTNPIRLWGSMQWSGKTILINNFAIPGLNWDQIAEYSKGDYVLSGCNYMLVEAPIYHDGNYTKAEVKSRVDSFISKIKSYANLELLIFSCSPGGIAPLGGSVSLGDELPSTYPGENHYLTFKNYVKILSPTVTTDPDLKDTYQITIDGTDYTLAFLRISGSDYIFRAPDTMPLDTISSSVVLTRLTGSGDATITGSGLEKYIAFTMEEHSYIVSQSCVANNVYFIDALNVFKQVAETHGDVLNDPNGFDMPISHPDYAYISSLVGDPNYPYLSLPIKMNYMSNFFSYSDGHHLKFTAHKIFFESLKKVLKESYFKNV